MESIGELIEKLVIANIKLWMVKDGQTALACRNPADIGLLQDQLIGLARADVLGGEQKDGAGALQELIKRIEVAIAEGRGKPWETLKELVRKDIELCEVRAALRREINQRLGDRSPTDTVKKYGD